MTSETNPRSLPDPAACRAQFYGIGLMTECLVTAPDGCAHASRVGRLVFCNHPDRLEIVHRALAAARRPPGVDNGGK